MNERINQLIDENAELRAENERLKKDLAGEYEGAKKLHSELFEVKQRAESIERERDELIVQCLNDKTLDLVRCGIGGNYGGSCYDTAIEKYHTPLVELRKQFRKGGE